MSKKGQKNRRFTPEEDARLVELRLQHSGRRGAGGIRTIAAIMGRPASSIQIRLQRLAERDEAEQP